MTVNNSCGRPRVVRLFSALFFTLAIASCTRNSAGSNPPDTGAPPAAPPAQAVSQESEWRAIEQLEAQAKSIAKVDGCNASADCASGEIGRKACGSPRDYLIYCTRTTDVPALKTKLEEIIKAEMAYNQKYDVVSTCEMRMPPAVEASAGSCKAK